MVTIATSRYAARDKVVASGLAPVRTTIGAPKFPLGYELAGSVAMLAPYGLFSIDDRVEFEAAYRARLDRFGVEKFRRVPSFATVWKAWKATNSPSSVRTVTTG
jgi:hypothetical protein